MLALASTVILLSQYAFNIHLYRIATLFVEYSGRTSIEIYNRDPLYGDMFVTKCFISILIFHGDLCTSIV